MIPLVLAVVAAPALGVLAVEARRATRAAAARAARRHECPFEDDDDVPRPLLAELAAVVTESAAVAWLTLRGLFGMPALAAEAARGEPVVVLVPEHGFGAASLVPLGRRVAAALGARLAAEPHARDRSLDGRVARLGEFLDALGATKPAPDTVLVGHGAGGVVACRAVAGRFRPWVRHVVTLATEHEEADTAGVATRTAVVSVYSLHDARIVPPARAYLPDAFNIVVRGVGHASLVLASRTSHLVVEALADEREARAAEPVA